MNREDLLAPKVYNIVEEVEKYASNPNKIAIKWENDLGETKEITYKDLIKRVNQIGNVFIENGLQKGDTILIIVPRLIEAYQVYLAALKTGIVVIPSSEMLKTKDLQYRIQHGDVKGIVSYYPYVNQFEEVIESHQLKRFVIGKEISNWLYLNELADKASDSLEITRTSKDDMAFLSYTSGTTGNPKGVVHTHGWGYAHLRTAAPHWLCIEENDTVWATAGPGWQKWIWSPFLSVLGSGATGFVYNGKFDPKTYLSLLDKHEVNVLCCTPTEYRLMAKVDNLSDYQLKHIHSAVSAGEPLNREVIETFQKYFNITVRDGYGQTENTLLVGITKDMELKPGSMGKPTPGNRVEVINEHGQPCKVGEVGDIAVHIETPALFKNYYKDPERTAMQFRGDYYVTGDKAKKDEEGYLWFEGRGDDIIISSGYTIGPFEVEDALVKHPDVKECAVVASPDEVRGNIVKAFVVLQDGVDPEKPDLIKSLQNHVKDLTAPYKYPREIEFIQELPKTTSGKIRRIELRQQELEKAK
ncbi:acyl--CoA ligase [Heyndrickxia sporothermodurans]|uniref:Acyl--CoA ligase n=1 Tax=Heyndrickxia sporothermodurans TaxID=46224 RepID=A0AB37H7U4_9BACI|nr:acyl--CoA ligase [Heyndrickxia sporothermodurans]MBL5766336.1 acyl--CoA ligase [Heyndrickxia sporothermodurans]MBL5769775.1 acyl--CoA ligase [Heyndrickxia sporothermodurans]MBL5773476.1 acyl--CoA ligase [Heyndrickxia sporothermodurans]MBL5777633.1 acyl--CoA ligase [Heyndrickxia sporothermodurans]MBL5781219.1 acyl--CoA ligase [Heyndrickxia sporothermodurans]